MCDAHLGLDQADIEACYGAPASLPPLLADCAADWGESVCALSLHQLLDAEPDGSPVRALSRDDAQGICAAFNVWHPATRPEGDALDELLREISGDCPVGVSSHWLGGCVTPLEYEVEPLGDCAR